MSAIAGESSGESPTRNSADDNVPENIPWAEYALQQAQIAQKTIESNVENAIEVTRSRVDRIRTTSSAHFNQTIVIFSNFQLFRFSFLQSLLSIRKKKKKKVENIANSPLAVYSAAE